jgi:hypothetical protein
MTKTRETEVMATLSLLIAFVSANHHAETHEGTPCIVCDMIERARAVRDKEAQP